ncbi:NAD kinase 2, mitochondrial [Daktulosphaira vitifoliae]|uniref:NAD kinase 2, mitochondrial n=1 Tax=Daktulosphaira vitifoliae TaxID=58002 RepID=UPI0021AA7EA2|nr:NAD kinase 2, mitochondrial [Daktulosphaira vitifoliae]
MIIKRTFKQISVGRRYMQLWKGKKVLMVAKYSRVEREQLENQNIPEKQLLNQLSAQGVNLKTVLDTHNEHYNVVKEVKAAIKQLDVESKIISLKDINTTAVSWADVLIAIGGDGTYLVMSSYVQDNSKEVVGINSNPSSSLGYLCLPSVCSQNIERTFDMLEKQKFTYINRTRIRVSMKCAEKKIEPPVNMYQDFLKIKPDSHSTHDMLALNEVFIGDKMPGRTSELECKFDHDDPIKIKSSGLCISTGTGSSAWSYSLNKISIDQVRRLFKYGKVNLSKKECEEMVIRYNKSLVYSPSSDKLKYTIREPTGKLLWLADGLITSDEIKKAIVENHCEEGCIILDGFLIYVFPKGAQAVLSSKPEDSIRSVWITDHDLKN